VKTKHFSNIKLDGQYFLDNRDDFGIGSWKTGTSRLVRLLIHEASHRFAGTEDHCYIDEDPNQFRDTAPEAGDCIENADSYAWLAMAFVFCQRKGDFTT
jgi:hypothetical protein